MDYEKHVWVVGEVITAEKLNHMEDGIANMYGENASQESEEAESEGDAE